MERPNILDEIFSFAQITDSLGLRNYSDAALKTEIERRELQSKAAKEKKNKLQEKFQDIFKKAKIDITEEINPSTYQFKFTTDDYSGHGTLSIDSKHL